MREEKKMGERERVRKLGDFWPDTSVDVWQRAERARQQTERGEREREREREKERERERLCD